MTDLTSNAKSRPKRTPGRPKGQGSTREALLKAAIAEFAQRGYDGATLRAITARAGVDVALVRHFFGGKQGLFEEAILKQAEKALEHLSQVEDGSDSATRLLNAYFDLWESPQTALLVRALFRAGLESPERLARLQDLLTTYLTEQVMGTPATDNSLIKKTAQDYLRIQTLGSQLLGVGLSRYIIKTPPLSNVSREEVIATLLPTVEIALRQSSTSPAN